MMPLREARRRRFLSLEGLAKKAGISTQTVFGIEKRGAVPRLKTIQRICAALEMEPDEIAEFHRAIVGDGERGEEEGR